jgi:hypothetical protein
VERADDAAFEYRPETFNCIRVYGTDDVLALLVLDRLAWIFCQPVIDVAFVAREQADFVRNHLSHESLSVLAGHVVEHASNHVALTLNSTNNRRLARALAAATMNFLINMLVRVLAADVGFINLATAAFKDCMKSRGYQWLSTKLVQDPPRKQTTDNGSFIDPDNGMLCQHTGFAEVCGPPPGTVHYTNKHGLNCTRTGIMSVCTSF